MAQLHFQQLLFQSSVSHDPSFWYADLKLKKYFLEVRDNQRLALMHALEAKNRPDAKRLPLRSAIKLFNAQLAVDYPAYSMVNWSFAK